MGSWLEGPPVGSGGLGLPTQGPGSRAGLGRRVLALLVDWVACSLISAAFVDYHPLATLGVFAAQNLVPVMLLVSTLGHHPCDLRVRPLEAHPRDFPDRVPGVR